MVYGEFVQQPQTKLAKLLSENLPKSLSCSYFVNSGTEAIEGALKLAKDILENQKSYHLKNHITVQLLVHCLSWVMKIRNQIIDH